MTLAELTSYVTEKTGYVEDSDIAFCKKAISKRYELIYNQYLWKDALVGVTVAIDPTTDDDHAEGVVLVPKGIDRVVGVRTPQSNESSWTGQSLRVNGLENYYRIDWDEFSQTGTPMEFALLSPVWFVWHGALGLKVTSVAGDDGQKIKVTWLDSLGRRQVDTITLASANPPLLTGGNTPTLVITGNEEVNGTYGWISGGPNAGTFYDGDLNYIYYDATPTARWRLIADGSQAYYSLTGLTGTWHVDAFGDAPAPSVAYGVSDRIEVQSVFRVAGNGAVTLAPQLVGEPDGGALAATTTGSDTFQRLRILPKPTLAGTIAICGKLSCVPLDFDNERPLLANLDNCLIAFATAEMLERGRQYGKAQAKIQEAEVLLQELAKLETVQQAYHCRIVPEAGYGDPYFSPGQRGGLFF